MVDRHTDSVAALRSLRASLIEREVVTETLTLRPDSVTGELRVVAHDIARRKERTAETAKEADTARFVAQDVQTYHHEEKTAAAATETPRRNLSWFAIGIWVGFTALVLLLAAILLKTWTSRR